MLFFENVAKLVQSDEEAQEKVKKEIDYKLNAMEENIADIVPGGISSIDEKSLGHLDIMMTPQLRLNKAIEEAFGVKIVDQEKTPMLSSWIIALDQMPVVEETIAPNEKLVQVMHLVRQSALQSPTT
ncbi:hypothetical protein CRYUN_Cryun07bG0045900 [Craigia yunnanensis]